MNSKIRLDLHLLTKGLASSRQKAQQLIRAGKVRDVHGNLLDKPGQEVPIGLELTVKKPPRFVSRGGEKLIHGLKSFAIDVEQRVCLDGGISTGGFTDCLLQEGASRIYGIDVGYGQTAWSIRNNPKVVLKERTNIRTLTPELLYGSNDQWPTFAVADLSFISLRLVIPVLKSLLHKENAEALLLVKPQFEVGRSRVGKGGVVRDQNAHVDALNTVVVSAINAGWRTRGIVASPITGPAGNHEYLLWLGLQQAGEMQDIEKLVASTLI